MPLLEARGIGKQFPGVRALGNVDFSIEKGQVVSLLGENGAGKSTLMKILAGVQPPDEGEIFIDGSKVTIDSVQEGLDLGIALIHQELNLATNLTVAANIFLGREPHRAGWIENDRLESEATRYLDLVGLEVDPSTPVSSLPIGKQQLVEIAKALSIDANILIMDEPTSSLSTGEAQRLFEVIDDLRGRGTSIIYISHRLGEVKQLSDRVVVLRDGRNAGELEKEEIDHDRMISLMVGREFSDFYQHSPRERGKERLAVRDFRSSEFPDSTVTFSIRSGEIVGVAGLIGAGRTSLLEAIFGIAPSPGGDLFINGEKVVVKSPAEAISTGMALVPEDRKQQGLMVEMEVGRNLILPSLRNKHRCGFVSDAAEKEVATRLIGQIRIKTSSTEQIVRFLSGGNQQKVVLGKWLELEPAILLLDEPTRGVDIGAKQEIYSLMEQLAQRGVAILFVSSEMEEILGMSDRVLVMHEGRITGELGRDRLGEEAVMKLATGVID